MSNEGRSIGGRKDGPAFPGSRERTCAEYVRLMDALKKSLRAPGAGGRDHA